MSRPKTHPGNADKHPGKIVQDANKVRQSKEEVAAEKGRKQAEKDTRAAAVEKARTKIAAAEDAMAVEQSVEVDGPPKLVQPWPRMSAADEEIQPVKRRHPGLKLTFRESVITNCKVTNDGVSVSVSDTTNTRVGSTIVGNGKIKGHANQKGLDGLDSELEGPITAWVDKIASWPQLKPSAPPSTTQPSKIRYLAEPDLKEPPEEFDEQPRRQGTKDIVNVIQKPKGAVRIKKHSNTVIEAPEDLGSLADTEEGLEILKDPEAAEDENSAIEQSNLDNVESDAGQDDMMEDGDGKALTWRLRLRLRSLRLNDYGWSIPESELEVALEDIFDAVRPHEQGPSSFDAGGPAFAVATQRIHECVLMALFSSEPEYKTQAACKEYAEDQIEDLRFIYEDPDNNDHPGAFLSEYILHVFAAHLAAIIGRVRVDALIEFGKPSYITALALTAAAAEHALCLVRDRLILDSDPADNCDKKPYKILLTLNEATNKMSNTGTAFSSGNWETDTIAYVQSIKDLPHSRIQEIVMRAEEFMKLSHRKGRTSEDVQSGANGVTIIPALGAYECHRHILPCPKEKSKALVTSAIQFSSYPLWNHFSPIARCPVRHLGIPSSHVLPMSTYLRWCVIFP
ncbi:hypothetical protein F4604DRAFT_1924727 [Suillus subluteus]|nr:hypothetical protein F4604DRAFT_1924727 [Suillus subluteus]